VDRTSSDASEGFLERRDEVERPLLAGVAMIEEMIEEVSDQGKS